MLFHVWKELVTWQFLEPIDPDSLTLVLDFLLLFGVNVRRQVFEAACLMKVLSKPELENHIILNELVLIMENFGVPDNLDFLDVNETNDDEEAVNGCASVNVEDNKSEDENDSGCKDSREGIFILLDSIS